MRPLDPDEFYMGDVCARLEAMGIPAYVETTGGGCATIYAGHSVTVGDVGTVSHGDVVMPYADSCTVHPVLGGPGMYDWHDPDRSRASRLEFVVGLDHMAYGWDDAPYHTMPEDCPDPVSWATERIAYYVVEVWGDR